MKEQANDVFEICSYVDGLEKKIDSMTEELTNMQNQIKEMQEDTLVNNAKKALSEAQERLNTRSEQIKSQVAEVKAQVKSTAKSIVDEAKAKGRAALYRVSEFLGLKKRLLDIRENVRGAIKTTDKDIAKTALLAKGFREAGQTVANAFRTFADKPEVDYSQKEQKHPITKAVLAPMKAVKKMLVSMELHLDASIDKLDNLAMNVQLDKEKHMENAKAQEQTEPERAEAERVEAEVVYSPMVAEPQEYQYNADAFEAILLPKKEIDGVTEKSKIAYLLLLFYLSLQECNLQNSDEFVIGIPYTNRTNAIQAGTQGFFVNMMPARLKLIGMSFEAQIKYLLDYLEKMSMYQDIPYEDIINGISFNDYKEKKEFLRFAFVYQSEMSLRSFDEGESIKMKEYHLGIPMFDMTIYINDTENFYEVMLETNNMINNETINFFFERFTSLYNNLSETQNLMLVDETINSI